MIFRGIVRGGSKVEKNDLCLARNVIREEADKNASTFPPWYLAIGIGIGSRSTMQIHWWIACLSTVMAGIIYAR